MHSATKRQLAGVAGLLAVAAGGLLLLTPAALLAAARDLTDEPVAFAVALLALYLVRSLFLWPVTLFSVLLGYLYDPWLALPVALAGAATTGIPPFLVARYAAGDSGLFGAVGDFGRRAVGAVGAFRGIVAARLVPIPTDAVSSAAGLSEVSLGTFVLGTALGELPWTVAAVVAGNSMRTLTLGGFAVDPGVVLGLVCLSLLVAGGPLYRWRRSDEVTS
jgi:uncharacterized membrane protein YdjX (TVP38/TMEM64 family)